MRSANKGGNGGNWQGGGGKQPNGDGDGPAAVDATVYSDEAIAELQYMMEEEKLAGDIYEAFYDLYGVQIFDNIAQSEDQHFEALKSQADAIGLDTDVFVFNEPGTYENPELQDLYDTLLAMGSASLEAALQVGVAIETKDMVDISAAADSVEGTALADVYDNLLAGSANHLDAFEALL